MAIAMTTGVNEWLEEAGDDDPGGEGGGEEEGNYTHKYTNYTCDWNYGFLFSNSFSYSKLLVFMFLFRHLYSLF